MQVQAFLQSVFLRALSHSLIASIWQMGLLWLAAVTVLKLFKFSAAQKFNIAFFAQFTGLLLFIYTCWHNYTTGDKQQIINTAFAGNFFSIINTVITQCMPYIAIVYLCMLMFKLSRLIFIYNNAKAFRKHELKKIAPTYRIFIQQMAELFSLHRKVKIYLSEKISCPFTVGFLKPLILIPAAAVNHLTTEQMEAVILHELAHIKRADYLLFILQNLADKIFFFNIFSSMLSDIIEWERENACDDWVLQFRYNNKHYAEALFKLGRLKALPALAIPLSGKKENILLLRIKRLLHNSQNSNFLSLQSALFSLFSLMVTACLIISFTLKPKQQKIENTAKTTAANQSNTVGIAINKKELSGNIAAVKQVKRIPVKNIFNDENFIAGEAASPQLININTEPEIKAAQYALAVKQNYLVQAQQSLDSLNQILPQYQKALNSQVVVTPQILQKAMSYQNFKRIEEMLAASGDAINITEANSSKNSYIKRITIEATDKNGNKNIYNVIVELYQ